MDDGPRIYAVMISVPGDVGGAEIRNYNLIKQLIKRVGAKLEVFCAASPANDPEVSQKIFESQVNAQCHIALQEPRSLISTMRAILLRRVPPFMEDFRSSGIGDMFRKVCEKSLPDIIHIEGLHAYYCIRPHISWLKRQHVKIVLDCHNIESRSFQDMLESFSLPKRLVGIFLAPHLKKLEIEATKRSDIVLACSASDADFFRSYNPKTYVIPNGVDCAKFQPVTKNRNAAPTIIFIGGTGYPPNIDGMQFYLSLIHIKVKERVPNITLLAIGIDQAWLDSQGIKDPSVKPLGFVKDVKPYLEQATIGICPLRYGAGTRLKILTYMAAGLAVVSTSKGAEGVNYVDGQDILLADDPQAFADAIIKLLNDPEQREMIAQNGRNFILENYDWDIIGNKLADAYRQVTRSL